ncbi:hypothetical protein CP500_022755 [Tychonema bourrellyi FEM_GT703]|uniref:Uncharacterized protein n=1 Tax=Tychonema bourrellyi FEM_GT703 TaxID=2040638 RepID=A0A2G4EUJ9_9CYAN|nr:hypothetical protein CP500_022755 [Tychonema bourrellyi FEM_GT703]
MFLIAENLTASNFHCIILKSSRPLWIGGTFNLYGFGQFLELIHKFGYKNTTLESRFLASVDLRTGKKQKQKEQNVICQLLKGDILPS